MFDFFVGDRGRRTLADAVLVHRHLGNGLVGGSAVHNIGHDLFCDGAQSACPRLPLRRQIGDGFHRFLGEVQFHPVQTEQLAVLPVEQPMILRRGDGMEDAVEELADHCGLTVERVRQLLQLNPEVCSLDAPAGEEDGTLGILLEDMQAPQPYEELVRDELKHTLNTLLAALSERQQQVLRLHFGMEDGVCHSLEDIGKLLGISKERVRQIEHQAMDKLKTSGASLGLEDFLE